jgi:hypothetical protein
MGSAGSTPRLGAPISMNYVGFRQFSILLKGRRQCVPAFARIVRIALSHAFAGPDVFHQGLIEAPIELESRLFSVLPDHLAKGMKTREHLH